MLFHTASLSIQHIDIHHKQPKTTSADLPRALFRPSTMLIRSISAPHTVQGAVSRARRKLQALAPCSPKHPQAPMAHAGVQSELRARRTQLCILSAHPRAAKNVGIEVGRGRRKKSIQMIFCISQIWARVSRGRHCGHARTNPSVRFSTGGSPRIFFGGEHGAGGSQSYFVRKLAALTSKLRS